MVARIDPMAGKEQHVASAPQDLKAASRRGNANLHLTVQAPRSPQSCIYCFRAVGRCHYYYTIHNICTATSNGMGVKNLLGASEQGMLRDTYITRMAACWLPGQCQLCGQCSFVVWKPSFSQPGWLEKM